MMLPLGRFDAQSKAILAGAYHISQRYHQAEVDPEHYLLALLEQPDGVTSQILKQLSADEQALRPQIEVIVSAKPKSQNQSSSQVFITPPAKLVLSRAVEESARFQDTLIKPEYIFLAILHQDNPTVARLLLDQGVTYARVDQLIRAARTSATG